MSALRCTSIIVSLRRAPNLHRRVVASLAVVGCSERLSTAATLAITAGVPLTVVSRTLRHCTLSTTANIYSHLTRQAAREAVDTIEHTLMRTEQKADRQARPKRPRSPRDHIQRLREALHRLRSPAPPAFCATAERPQLRPATTSPPGTRKAVLPEARERPPTCIKAGRDDRI
ncbi:hypothetical protein [Streptomyces sp. TLI_185]|uniref:hypothetical protein n=1 Tax=Streptomyces sp. TLI_185 TaxID=2485151 RepID=UPI000F50F796|nr:hypothetical protein [Streptomyces sp. TLI_185]